MAPLEGTLRHVQVSPDGREIYIEGANLHVRSGTGHTADASNGYGNLIIGYNEALPDYPFYDGQGTGVEKGGGSQKAGSHNLVIGDGHAEVLITEKEYFPNSPFLAFHSWQEERLT